MLLTGCLDSSTIDLDDGEDEGGGGASAEDGGGPTDSSGGHAEGGEGEGGEPIPPEDDPFEPAPTPPSFSESELASLRSEIDGALASASANYSVLIVGYETGQVVYSRAPDTARKPASNTKLFTTAAALVLDGEAGQPKAGVYAGTVNNGVVQGDLVLFGEHDPVFTSWFADDATQPLDAIAATLVARGITRVNGNVVAQGEFLYVGDSLGTIDFGAERSQVATAFRAALTSAGITVQGSATTSASVAPPGGSTLAVPLPSASLDAIAHAINVPSHNEMADLLMHHLGTRTNGPSTYAGGFAGVESVLDDLGVAHQGLMLNDGSGLSHNNRVTARHIVDVIRAVMPTEDGPAFVASMAVSGVRGTISGRMGGGDAAGRFFGKTGTLTGVIALSGVLFHRHDGQRYIASLLANDVGNSTAARGALDGAINALAKNRRGSAGLLAAPTMERVSDDHNGESVLVRFAPVPGATGYLLERSADGRAWRREDARLITATTHRSLTFGGEIYVRVRAIDSNGEGAPSSVLGARVTGTGPSTLCVDGDERYAAGPVGENPLRWGSDAIVAHGQAVAGPFESAAASFVASGGANLAPFDRVLWATGRDSVADESFNGEEQQAVAAYVQAGGRLLVSGAEIGYDLIEMGEASDAAFARDVLGIEYVGDDAFTTFVASPDLAALPVELARFSKLGRHVVEFADVLAASDGGSTCLEYVAGAIGAACISTETSSGGRVIVLGFPLESLDNPVVGAVLVDQL